jgi:Protein of unknown function (DUF2934)
MINQTAIQPSREHIAVYAYLVWEKEGRPHGRHEAHWLQAEKQLKADCAQEAGLLLRSDPAVPPEPPMIKPIRPKRRNNSNRREVVAA